MIELSHLKAKVSRAPGGGVYASRAKRLAARGEWVGFYIGGLLYAADKAELRDKLQEHNVSAQRRINAERVKSARIRRDFLLWDKRQENARAEYKEWLRTLPLSADAYKEDPSRFRLPGGPDQHAKRRSWAEWANLKARKHWPEETAKKKAELCEKYELGPDAVIR